MPDIIYHPNGEHLRGGEPALRELITEQLPKHLGMVALLQPYPFNPELHEEQRLDVVGARADVSTPEAITAIAERVFGKIAFDTLRTGFRNAQETLAQSVGLIDAGETFYLGTTHGRTDDVVAVEAAYLVELMNFIATEQLDVRPRTQLIISKFITGLGAQLGGTTLYIPPLLTTLGDVFYTLPASKSVRESGLTHQLREDYNRGVQQLLTLDEQEAKQTGRGIIRAVALSSSVHVQTNRYFGKMLKRPRQRHAAPVNYGTQSLLNNHYLLPVSVDIDQKEPFMRIHALRRFDRDNTTAIMDTLMRDLTESSGTEHVYHSSRETYDLALPNKPVIPTHWQTKEHLV